MTAESDPRAGAAAAPIESRRGERPWAGGSLGRELPRVPRRYGQWAAAVLFVLISVVAAGWFWQQKSDRVEVLAIQHAVSAGSVIERSDLNLVEVSGVEGAIPARDISTVVGKVAGVGLVPGQILTLDMVTSGTLPGPGQRVVGLELDGTRAPGGLKPGDAVVVLAVPPSGDASSPDALDSPTVLAPAATVVGVDLVEGAGTRFTLLVPKEAADRVAAYGAAGRISLVQAPLGGEG